MKNKSIKISDTGVNLTANCKKCGEPIDHSNEFGVFCKNNCYLEESNWSKNWPESLPEMRIGVFWKVMLLKNYHRRKRLTKRLKKFLVDF